MRVSFGERVKAHATHWQESTAFAAWWYGWLWTNVAPILDRLTGLS